MDMFFTKRRRFINHISGTKSGTFFGRELTEPLLDSPGGFKMPLGPDVKNRKR
jgi:hypothetical protein